MPVSMTHRANGSGADVFHPSQIQFDAWVIDCVCVVVAPRGIVIVKVMVAVIGGDDDNGGDTDNALICGGIISVIVV